MMTTMNNNDYVDFLAEYASLLLGCGATCIRIKKNVKRMTSRFSLDIDVTVMPAHIEVAEINNTGNGYVAVRRIKNCGIDFNINARLSALSWDVADGKCSFVDARAAFLRIKETGKTNKWEVLFLASAANAAFCRIFGGDLVAMLIVFVSTVAGFRLKQIMTEYNCDVRISVLCASFFSSTLSAGGYIFGIGGTPEIALGSSVLYLIPGVPYINAVSDIINRDYLCAYSRFVDAAVLTVCLSAGLCSGMFILGLNWF